MGFDDLVVERGVDCCGGYIGAITAIRSQRGDEIRRILLLQNASIARQFRKPGTDEVSDDRTVEVRGDRDEVRDYGSRAWPVFQRPLDIEGALGPGD